MSHTWAEIARRIRVPLGFVFAMAYLWFARPAWWSLLVGCAVVTPGILLRALASGHVRKNRELTTSGPYAHTRNPLYLGSIIMATGFAVAARNIWIAVAITALFLAIYLPVILAEERFLRSAFPEFAGYAQQVPRLLPRLSAADGSKEHFSRELYLNHREYNAALGAAAMMLALTAKLLWWNR